MNKNDKEKYYFEKFCALYPLPIGEVIYTDKPDVIIKGEKALGIEITNLFYDQDEERQINMREHSLKLAQNLYREKNEENIEISFGFNKDFPIQKINSFAEKLAALAEKLKNHPKGRVRTELFSEAPEISSVHLSGIYEDAKWRKVQCYNIPMLDQNLLIKAIRKKEHKICGYQGCDCYWLLGIVDYWTVSQDQEIINAHIDEIESSVFEKIIIYKTGTDEIRELPVKKPTS